MEKKRTTQFTTEGGVLVLAREKFVGCSCQQFSEQFLEPQAASLLNLRHLIKLYTASLGRCIFPADHVYQRCMLMLF